MKTNTNTEIAETPNESAQTVTMSNGQDSVELSYGAYDAARAVSVNPFDDLAALRDGTHTEDSLLAECLDGTDGDRRLTQHWRDYVAAVVAAAEVQS